MAWVIPFTALTGNVISSSSWNSSVKDNMNNSAVGLASAAGDIFYASGASTLAKLALGTKFQKLRSNVGGTALEWSAQHIGALLTKTTGTHTLTTGGFSFPVYDTIEFQNGSSIISGSPPYTGIAPPVAGTYIATATIAVQTNNTDCNIIFSVSNGGNSKAFFKSLRSTGTSALMNLNISGIFSLAVGDSIITSIYQDSGVSMFSSNAGNKYECTLGLVLVAV